MTYLPINHDRNDHLRPALRITGNMPREIEHIIHNQRLLFQRGSPADALPEEYQLAGGFSLERTQQEFLFVRIGVGDGDRRRPHHGRAGGLRRDGRGKGGEFVIANIKTGPVDRGGGSG